MDAFTHVNKGLWCETSKCNRDVPQKVRFVALRADFAVLGVGGEGRSAPPIGTQSHSFKHRVCAVLLQVCCMQPVL